ncbi:MAG: D-glycero-beta-D-manno-heptose 1-phosphate adenylyltransferase [Planctomycetota bacterium]
MSLIDLVHAMPGKRIVLVGDFMLDRYLYGNAERLSPEAPVPVLHFNREEQRLGGAGSVAADLAALGCVVHCVGVTGTDPASHELRRLLEASGARGDDLVPDSGRPTTAKVRLVGKVSNRPGQMLRLDYEDAGPVPDEVAEQIVRRAEAALADADALCLEDYAKGVLTPDVCRRLIDAARVLGKPVLIDPARVDDFSKYAGATLLKLNRVETCKATGQPCETIADFERSAATLLDRLDLEAVVVTADKDGAYLATRDGVSRHLATKARDVSDVTGAGDMMLAGLTAARAAGADWASATALANVAAGLEVERFGAVPVEPREIVAELLAEVHAAGGKVRELEGLLPEIAQHKAAGKRIVFTNGCFDVLHLGHVQYFRFARRQGDVLVVGVNTDESIRRLKGEKRPVVPEDDRVGVLEELESIDYLVKFGDDTPMRLIDALLPDVLVKGADYAEHEVVGHEVVKANGGSVALAPLVDGRSTTNLIARVLDAYGERNPTAT